ncbi:MAG: amidophosphoribosyltransferase [Clostridia bacterium]|nr:amidophosphoribosyltransferase [Clostridia bacterium]
MFDKVKEECGVFGIYAKEAKEDLVGQVCVGLSALQHRGEESCGVAINEDGILHFHKDVGLVSEVFTKEMQRDMPQGKMAIGHVRYSTTGISKKENAQPMVVRHKKGNLALVHNGNITNAVELKKELEEQGAIFTTTSDTEIICHIIVRERLKTQSIEEAVKNTMKIIKGAYSLLILSPQKMIAVRDPQGFRPLCMGSFEEEIVFASESCALDIMGATFERDIEPGEIVTITNNEVKSEKFLPNEKKGMCVFEYIYFARPDSTIDGINVHLFREEAGRCLAKQAPVEADIVASVPDSGNDAALGYSKQSKIPYDIVFVKSKYVGRTFIQNTQNKRKKLVNLKLNPLKHTVKDKKIVLVDDSIVRGTTITKIIKSLREAGAKEVHIRVASPAFVDVCYFGTDVDKKENLIAHGKTVEEIRQEIGADTLEYLSLDSLREITKSCKVNGFCDGCFTGKYPIEVPKNIDKDKFEKIQF